MAARAAIDLAADKLIVMTTQESQPLDLPLWLPLSDAEAMLLRMAPPGQHGEMEMLEDDLQRGEQQRLGTDVQRQLVSRCHCVVCVLGESCRRRT